MKNKLRTIYDGSIGDFQRIVEIQKDESNDPLIKRYLIIGVLENISESKIMETTGGEMMKLQRKYDLEVSVVPDPDPSFTESFTCGGVKYSLLPLSVTRQTVVQEDLVDVVKYHFVMAKFMCDDMANYQEKLNDRAALFQKKMPISYAIFIIQKVGAQGQHRSDKIK